LKFKSLKTKVLFLFSALSFIVLLIFSVSFYYFFEKSFVLSIENKLYNEAVHIKENLNTQPLISIKHKFPFAIVKNDKIVFKTKEFDFKNINNLKFSFNIIDNNEFSSAIYLMYIKKSSNTKIIILEKEIDERLEDILYAMLILEPILLLMLIYIANKMLDKVLVPVKSISNIAKNISVNNFNEKITLHNSEDEIKELAQTFNDMIDRLRDGVEKIERFNSDVSHELKTPLTVINGQIELALNKERDIEYYKKSIKNIQNESNKIQNIVEELLLLSKYSKENLKKDFLMCDFNALLLETLEKYTFKAKDKNIEIEIERFDKVISKANAMLIATIFSNLIDNAIKYTLKDKNIYISLYKDERIHFIIKDEGIGIPQDKLPFITDRFYRVDESRNKKIKGFGLGLSIVKNSVELHGGVLHVDSTEGVGTTLHVEI
jgi:signal transduction histidine kinase